MLEAEVRGARALALSPSGCYNDVSIRAASLSSCSFLLDIDRAELPVLLLIRRSEQRRVT
ncbi:hypothetical protein KTAU_02220 [Thermogemmatispora aurantia]|uniref:Uncharacterized protein n=1 Tax=Thermogemmatispora aurantia TaxID=2045279 RepID=A0A5J4JVC5_9CHLR|nr:hypothetical protein KTAU_02220 [Thermogemmatispora aurantia]